MTRPIEIFSGTGGVGKTTLATSRAYKLATEGKKVLLITIDPSKRLKEVLKISDDNSGEIVSINNPFEKETPIELDALLMNTTETIKRVGVETGVENFHKNRIVEILARPNGGLNEILAIVELNIRFKEKKYDVIVLDTPPGSHFLDFLESSEKIESFFDKKFIEIFKFISERDSVKSGSRFAMKLVSSGINKLIGYLEKVTGASFVRDFVEAVSVIYQTKDAFLDSLELKNKLKKKDFAHWYLVTSVDQGKATEAINLFTGAHEYLSESTVLLNKCIQENISNWNPSNVEEINLKETLYLREEKLKTIISEKFNKIISFGEILSNSPQKHIVELTNYWK